MAENEVEKFIAQLIADNRVMLFMKGNFVKDSKSVAIGLKSCCTNVGFEIKITATRDRDPAMRRG